MSTRPHSRPEQSRTEQSKTEQSKTDKSRTGRSGSENHDHETSEKKRSENEHSENEHSKIRHIKHEKHMKSSFIDHILKIFKRKKNNETSARDAIEELIEDDNTGKSIEQNECEMIGNVLDLRDILVQDIMIPRTSIISVPLTATIDEVLGKFVENQLSTILVYQDSMDNITGMLHLKDVANWIHMNKPFSVSSFMKEVLFIPPTMRTLDLLFKMKKTGIKIAVVIDEYGGVDGLVSFIDLIEEIVGDIRDATEIKHQKTKIVKNADGSIIVDGQSTFDEIKKYGNISIIPTDNDTDTIGGMLSSILGRLPVRGELVSLPEQKLEFEVLDVVPRKVKSIKIRYMKMQNTK